MTFLDSANASGRKFTFWLRLVHHKNYIQLPCNMRRCAVLNQAPGPCRSHPRRLAAAWPGCAGLTPWFSKTCILAYYNLLVRPKSVFCINNVSMHKHKNRKKCRKFKILLETWRITSKLSADSFVASRDHLAAQKSDFKKKILKKRRNTWTPPWLVECVISKFFLAAFGGKKYH